MSAPSVLLKIAESVRQRLEARKARLPASELAKQRARAPHDFMAALAPGPGAPRVIAEVKFASPSEGTLRAGGTAVEIARSYLGNGAAALSVLTEQDHFQGSLANLEAIRAAFPEARLLMKDFVIDPYQCLEARARGADAALLIVALLGEERTGELLAECERLGLAALVEVHDEEELAIAARVGARLIGVNNRDLKTLRISLDTSFRLAKLAPAGARLVCESGLSAGSELRCLGDAGFSAFLIGSSFMKQADPGAALARLLGETVAP